MRHTEDQISILMILDILGVILPLVFRIVALFHEQLMRKQQQWQRPSVFLFGSLINLQ